MDIIHFVRSVQTRSSPPAREKQAEIPQRMGTAVATVCLLMALGVVCVVFTNRIHRILPYLLGSIMAVGGIETAVYGFRTCEHKRRGTKLTSTGLICAAVGCVILVRGMRAYTLVGAAWGIIGLVEGAEGLNIVLYSVSHHEKCALEAVRTAIELVLAVLLLLDPIENLPHHIFLLGIEQICVALQLLHGFYRKRKAVPRTDAETPAK